MHEVAETEWSGNVNRGLSKSGVMMTSSSCVRCVARFEICACCNSCNFGGSDQFLSQ